jgi:hypothetical protein
MGAAPSSGVFHALDPDQAVRVSARCDRARLDASGAAGPGADATRVEAPAAGVRRASRRLNGAFLTIRPRLLPASSIPIYLSIGAGDHVFRYRPLDRADGVGNVGHTLTKFLYKGKPCSSATANACAAATAEIVWMRL